MIHPVFVCSKGRPDGSTFDLLEKSGIPYTILVEPQDVDKYAERRKILYALPENNQGIAYVRNQVLGLARVNCLKWIWMLDDDITSTFLVRDWKTVKTPIFDVLLAAQKELTNVPNLAQGALEYNQFAWSAKKSIAINSYCDVAVFINVERTKDLKYRKEFDLKEDRDFTLQCLRKGFFTARSCWTAFAAPKNGSNKGGLFEEYAKQGREREAAERMSREWPGTCEVVVKPSGRVDCKVIWKNFKAK
jgi:TET-Associated Glycosyltransferase